MRKRSHWSFILTIFLVLALYSCFLTVKTLLRNPISSGGEKLDGTEDIHLVNFDNFSVSPDGQWLIYPTNNLYVLYNIERKEKHEISLSDRARELSAQGYGPVGKRCWNPEGTKVFFPSKVRGYLYVVDLRSTEFKWEALEHVDEHEYQYYYECLALSSQQVANVRVIQRSSRRLDLVDSQNPERILARHTAGWLDGSIRIGSLAVSPDGTEVAYEIAGERWGIVSSSLGYVLCGISGTTESSQLLANNVGRFRWSPDSTTVYANVRTGEEMAIFRWEICKETVDQLRKTSADQFNH